MSKKKKVLLVEDDVFIGGMIANQITARGMELTRITTGDKVLPAMLRSLPDLVILDIFLPNLNGIEVLRAIRNNNVTKKVPVLVVTNTDQAKDRESVKELGAEFLSKSLTTPTKIVTHAENMLKLSR
ncbi:MAG TPA: response regulator [Candidatus Paceibacterota bacterium]